MGSKAMGVKLSCNEPRAKSLGKNVISRQGNLKSQEEKIISQEINMQKVGLFEVNDDVLQLSSLE